MNLKYSVRPLNNNFANEPIFETINLFEALEKARVTYSENHIKCIIVSCPEEVPNKSISEFK